MEIDNRGLACPLPVIKTRKAIQTLQTLLGLAMEVDNGDGISLVSIVDNEAALENVTRMIEKEGYLTQVKRREEGIYIHILPQSEQKEAPDSGIISEQRYEEKRTTTETDEEIEKRTKKEKEREKVSGESDTTKGTTVLITSTALGQGKEELGTILMRSFIISIKEMDFLPAHIIFLNSGVFLTAKNSPVLDELIEMEQGGVQILSCGTCVDYYQLKDEMAIGRITNMYDIAEYLQHSSKHLIL
jgi:selenium metabolism protein YedF